MRRLEGNTPDLKRTMKQFVFDSFNSSVRYDVENVFSSRHVRRNEDSSVSSLFVILNTVNLLAGPAGARHSHNKRVSFHSTNVRDLVRKQSRIYHPEK